MKLVKSVISISDVLNKLDHDGEKKRLSKFDELHFEIRGIRVN